MKFYRGGRRIYGGTGRNSHLHVTATTKGDQFQIQVAKANLEFQIKRGRR